MPVNILPFPLTSFGVYGLEVGATTSSTRGRRAEDPTKDCANCGRLFPQRRRWARYCSAACRWDAWNRRHPRVGVGEGANREREQQGGESA